MRLLDSEVSKILTIVSSYLMNYEVYLHGSRIDDQAKGGDVDLFLIVPDDVFESIGQKKHYISSELSQELSEQKIDLTLLKRSEKTENQFFNNSQKIKLGD